MRKVVVLRLTLLGLWVATPALAADAGAPAAPATAASPAAPATSSAPKPAAAPASQKPAPQKAAAKASSHGSKSGSNTKSTRTPESAQRRAIASGPTYDEAALGADTPELRALAAAERELFPPSQRDLSAPWPEELPFPVAATDDKPRVHASGLPPAPPPSAPPMVGEGGKDLSWVTKLEMPDLPVRWDPRVVRFLEFFKDDPRGRATFVLWHKRSGRYIGQVRKALRKKSLPEDLAALAMIESGFVPEARSPVGALGMWQFMAETGKIYGLNMDRWVDQRVAVTAATEAAADHLSDLHRRFGSWDLAMAAYNMGYGGVLQAVRRYNTNDYWALAKLEGSLPWETTLYVPKILAAAVVSHNLAAFGFQDVAQEAAVEGEEVMVAPGTALSTVAQACGATNEELKLLNPELRAQRTPPSQEDWPVKVPPAKASGCSAKLASARKEAPTDRYTVRFGESLEQIAQTRRTTAAKIIDLNGIQPGEVIRGGTTLIVPKVDPNAPAPPADPKDKTKAGDKPVVIVPQDVFVYPDRKRVFYRVQVADTLKDIATAFKVGPDEVRRWNDIDPSARLVEGMTLQIFAPPACDLGQTVVLHDSDVHTIVAGTEEFFRHWEDKGRRRTVVTAKQGETIEQIGRRFGVSSALMERINRRNRGEILAEGQQVVVWSPGPQPPMPDSNAAQTAALAKPPVAAERTPPLANPPAPSLLPALP